MTRTNQLNQSWWQSKATALLKEYEESYNDGTFVPAKLHGWKYKGHHVRIRLGQHYGTGELTITDPTNETGNMFGITIKYSYRPRRKLEFAVAPAKNPMLLMFIRHLRVTAMPNSAMSKNYAAKASHPSLLRSALKHDGLSEWLERHPGVHLRLRVKNGIATLSCANKVKEADVNSLQDVVELTKLVLQALEEQSAVGEPIHTHRRND
ncbi:hypothetical protein [Paenibacillus sanguinis]|uniref:hypothetical protein n=1 Tax=Paenibacillus sanguinis TaxID=225906 RepID=UPI0003803C7C|nr:hypothetical protein [Paenibacillus sanguinis]